MKHAMLAAMAALALAACQPAATTSTAETTATSTVEPFITAALVDAARTEAERDRDAARHPAETLAFAQVHPGAKIVELLPGEGYFTRLFATAIGPEGRVYAVNRTHPSQYEHPVLADVANVTNLSADYDKFTVTEPVDIVFTAQNYHDLKITSYHMGDTVEMDRRAFAALKPGGVYIVIDHVAAAGSSENQANPLHRIDPAVVRREAESVGFVFDGELDVLHNAADPHTASVFDESIRGHTDQFAMRFRKPS